MKKILLLGGSSQQIVAIKKAKKLGLYTILCDYLSDNPGQEYADKYYQISTTDKESVLKIAISERIDYILSYASDPAAPTAAFVAEKLGLPTNPYNSVDILCNKDRFRAFLLENGFNVPKSVSFSDKNEFPEILEKIKILKYPIIIKPVDSSGSKGITVIRERILTENAIKKAFSFSRSKRIIIEEYIEKKHKYLIGGDIFVSEGKVIQWGLMNCHRDRRVNELVPVGKSYPLDIDKSDIIKVQNVLSKLIEKTGINFGPLNVELIIDKNDNVYLIDVGPRSGGNMIPDLLSMIFDCDLVEMSVKSAMGENIRIDNNKENLYYSTLNLHSEKTGILKEIQFDSYIESYIVRKCVYKRANEKINYFSNASDALGIIFFRFNDKDTMLKTMDNINTHVKIEIV